MKKNIKKLNVLLILSRKIWNRYKSALIYKERNARVSTETR